MTLIFATNNKNKVTEVQAAIGTAFTLVTLQEAGIDIDIPEPHATLEANATEKSTTINRLTGLACFSEDTGLEVAALGGEPGVKSARYAGADKDFTANIQLLLHKLNKQVDRKARFRTIISLILDGQETLFEGICEGTIGIHPAGEKGFGYDPVFTPTGATKTFAEMTIAEKNIYSHRRIATDQLIAFLQAHLNK
ncbi:MAG: RdgB/HAM1 family non-canonical purine NTP pyrophosphatase [Sphingobacteriales bacterium]|jgi:XTP/dITP diphosphohydrolase|nr:MAG: RdgB/HAM1 family non-canonical purine NTP pyrophosphatase [Sphingobacteriales bacterium]